MLAADALPHEIDDVCSSHCEVTSAELLAAVKAPDVRSCRWRRGEPLPAAALSAWTADMAPSEREVRDERDPCSALSLLLPDTDRSEAAAWLRTDIARLLAKYRRLRPVGSCRVRLEKVMRPACRRFHHDFVWLRLVCTYVGAGTWLVPHEHAVIAEIERCTGSIEEQNARIVPDSRRVLPCDPGDVLLLKGARDPETGGTGAIHRSPAASPQAPRLVLTIDDDGA